MSRRPRPRTTHGWRVVTAVALVLVAVADVLLLAQALRPAVPVGSALVVEAIDEDPVPATTAIPERPGAGLASTARLLAAVDERVAWRSDTVGCGDGSVVIERTVDAGDTWAAVPVADVSGVLALVPGDDGQTVSTVLAGADCAALTRTSFTGGTFWRDDDAAPESAVYVDPADPRRGRVPGGAWMTMPCDTVASLAALDHLRAGVLCADGVIRLTRDGGASWRAAEGVDEPRALAPSGDGYWIAAASPECSGVFLVQLDAQGGRIAATCTAVEPASAVALSAAGDSVWVWGTTVEVVARAR